MESQLLTTGQAAKLCGVTSDAVLKWIKKGRLPATRTTGGHFRIARAALEATGRMDAAASTGLEPAVADSPAPVPRRCWEHFHRDLAPSDACKKCVVYRAKIEKCYEVAELGDSIGHSGRFCQATCEECSFFRSCHGLALSVLVVTGDESLIARLTAEAEAGDVALRFARCGYDTSMLIEKFHPSAVVVDSMLPEVRDGRLTD